MTDIPRNELLDKLAAGWKVRRKSWEKHHPYFLSLKENETITPSALVADDWEGEPPLPELKSARCHIAFAFAELKNHEAKFIRRAAWKSGWKCTFDANRPIDLQKYELSLDDILSFDWEIWN